MNEAAAAGEDYAGQPGGTLARAAARHGGTDAPTARIRKQPS